MTTHHPTTTAPQLSDEGVSNMIRLHTGLSENDHNDLIIDAGVDYAGRQGSFTERGRQKLLQSRMFWQWWWRNWLAVDRAILANVETLHATSLPANEYLRAHLMAHSYELPKIMWRKLFIDADCKPQGHRSVQSRYSTAQP
ncbi:MAG: hypothetical protein Q8L89_04285 [Gammaproteobacteria bacterium]|nr:hypothetical protein [Gammaproteobacteria bacterium]